MRINKFVAQASGMSRRAADQAISEHRVIINGRVATAGDQAEPGDAVTLDLKPLQAPQEHQTILVNKPVGVVCSRQGQGSRTIYDLLPASLHHLKPIGRLDKDSSGLLVMTSNGDLANRLSHPSFEKIKRYEISLDRPLAAADHTQVRQGVKLDDGPSKLDLTARDRAGIHWLVSMREGRNRQIRRTFSALQYSVRQLHRIQFGDYQLSPTLASGQFQIVKEKT